MNIQTVKNTPAFSCFCYRCNRSIRAENPKWADLDGPAFRAYYCQECIEQITKEGKNHEVQN